MSNKRTPLMIGGGLLVAILVGLGVWLGPQAMSTPTVISTNPADGSSAANPRVPIEIVLNQPVQSGSTSGITIEPAVPLTITSVGSRLQITAADGLAYNTSYRLTITGLKNAFGRAQATPVTIAFTTVPYVAVQEFGPAQGTTGVALRAPVTVVFDAPVVTAEQLAAAADDPRLADTLPQPLVLAPANAPATPVQGVGRWLSPTLFGFYPSDALSAATTYRALVRQDVSGDGMARLEREVNWDFVTAAPLLEGFRPFDGETDVAPTQPIEVRLAHDVDRAAAGKAFTLQTAGGDLIAGTVETSDAGFLFRPATPLAHGASYKATLAAGIASLSGVRLNEQPVSWSFGVIGDPEVLQVEPLPATGEVLISTRRISVHFNHPIVALTAVSDQSKLPNPLTISPALAGVGSWLDTSTYVFSPTAQLEPSTTYRMVVAAGLTDQTGGTLRNEYRWEFTTISPQLVDWMPQGSDLSPTSTLQLVFNQPMLESDLGQIRIEASDGSGVAGSTRLDGSTWEFTPAAPLGRGVTYRLNVPAGLRSANGKGSLAQTYTGTFRVAPLPRLLESDPAGGDQSAWPGSLSLIFSTEMDWASVDRNLTIEPAVTGVYTYTYENRYELDARFAAETSYRVTIGADTRDRFGVPIGTPTVIAFRTAPLEPSLSIASTGSRIGAYNAYVPVRVPLQIINIDQVRYSLERLDPPRAIMLASNYDAWQSYSIRSDTALRSDALATPGDRNRTRVSLLDLGKLEPGLYLVEVRFGSSVDRQILAVSPYALTAKRSASELFVWAVDLATGKPVANLNLERSSYDYSTEAVTAVKPAGTTASDGTLRMPLATDEIYYTMYLWASGATPAAFLTSDWGNGINAWDFGLPGSSGESPLVGSLSTDRPIYRPDQLVRVRGALRIRVPGQQGSPDSYRTPAGETVDFVVSDPDGNNVLTRTLTLSEFGTFNTDVPLTRQAPLGGYSMYATLASEPDQIAYGSFTVAEYRKPTFEIEVVPSKTELVQGENFTTAATARYFAGGVLGNAPVQWRLLAQPFSFSEESLPGFSFDAADDAYDWYRGDEGLNGQSMIANGTGKTDAQGRFSIDLPADLYGKVAGDQAGQQGSARLLTIEIEVSDVDGQVITSQSTVRVHPAEFYIGIRPQGYVVNVGDTQAIDLVTVTPQGDPTPNHTAQVEIFRREWYSVRERGSDGQLYWTSSYTDTLVQTLSATTDAKGRAQVSFKPTEGGSYRLVASAKDAQGRETRSAGFSWVYGGDVFWGVDDTNRIDLVADKRLYQPGDTAEILVTAPYAGMQGLLTIERNSVLEHRLITIQGTSELIKIPLKGAYAPNVYASLVLIKTACTGTTSGEPCPAYPDLRVGLVNLPIATQQQELTITVTPDKPQAGPRDTVTYAIRATDYTGAGVRAEVGLALVDKAVLSLADDPNPDLVSSFYRRQPLGVNTSQTLTALVDRVTVRLQPGDKGGDGDKVGGTVRRDFPDTAYWNPAVVTGDDGNASVTVTLPDSLTTWRMLARGLTADTRVGQANADIVATKPLYVRPAFPRFLTAGDKPTLQAVVQNGSTGQIDATITMAVLGDQASLLALGSPAQQQVQVPAGGTALVGWPVTLNSSVPAGGALTIQLTVEGGGQRDAVEVVLPIQRYVTPEVVASAGQVLDTTVETIERGTGDGTIEVEMVPSVAAGVYTGLDYLEAFPYECVEQTVSKFLPNAVTYRLFKQAGRDDPALRTGLEQNLALGLQKLSAAQRLDGGWGWWQNDKSNPYITAYVLQGLIEAQKAGMQVDQSMLNAGLDYLEQALNGSALQLGSGEGVDEARAYALFVLSEAGRPDRGRMVALFEKRANLQVYGRSYLLMGLVGAGGEETRVRTLVGELMSQAVLSTTEAHWEEATSHYWTMSSNTRSTALALQALVRAGSQVQNATEAAPTLFLAPNAVRYLMGLREHGHWETTQESAVVAMALAEYVAVTGELKADYRYSLTLDGKAVREGQATSANLADPVQVALALSDLAGPQGQLAFQKQGTGRLYYTLRIRSLVAASSVEALDRGLQVERQYLAVASDTLSATGQLVNEAQVGQVVQVRLTLRIPTDMTYFAVEDMLPAGLEPLDASLKTVSSIVEEPQLNDDGSYPYWWYFGQSSIRDDRVALFATDLPRGTYTYTYLARATSPGVYQTRPAIGYQMYAPEVFGRSAGSQFTVVAP